MASIYQRVFVLLIFVTLVSAVVDECVKKDTEDVSTMETQIKEHVLCDYDKSERPTLDNKPTNITFLLKPDKIDFSDYGQYVILESRFILTWKDVHMSWNPSDFDNKRTIILSSDEIWTPDLAVYNKGKYGIKELISSPVECTVKYTNFVICLVTTSLEGSCIPDYRYWPLDTQTCTIKIGSWYQTGNEIGYSETRIFSESRSNEWNVKSLNMEVDPGIFKSYPNETFPTVKIKIVINRKFGPQFVEVVLPFLVLVSLTFLTLSFDPRYSERIYFSMLSIPCHIMMLLQYVWDVPESGDVVPYILKYLRNSNLLISIILIETMVVRYLLSKDTVSPNWLTSLVGKMVDNKVGKMLLYREFKEPDKDVESSEENGTEIEMKAKPTDWYLLGRLIDSVLYFITIVWYIVSFLICIT